MNPRLRFALDLRKYWPDPPTGVHSTAIVEHATFGANVTVGAYTVIGGPGCGFEQDDDGWFRIPHKGAVTIGDNVEIGAHCVIARGTLTNTTIGTGTKIDDRVFVAHNVKIGEHTLIIAGAEVSGSVRIGDGCQIGPQACIREHITIGDGAQVGIGAVVIRDVAPGMIVVGNPARELRPR